MSGDASTPRSPSTSRSASRNRRLIVVALIAVAAIVVLKLQKEPVVPRLPEPAPIDYSKDVKKRVEQAITEDQAALRQFQTSLSAALTKYGSESDKAAATAAEYASTYDSIVRTIGYLAYDQLKGTDTAGAYLNALIEPLLKPPVDLLVRDVNAATLVLENDLQKISVRLAVDLAALGPGPAAVPKTFTSSQQVKQDFDKTLRNLGIDAAAIGVSAALDVYAIVSTRLIPRLVTTITAIAAKLFAKQVGKAVVVIMGPLADGPLPIGDVIALVFAAWTAYDIYQIQPKFHENVRTAVGNQLRETGAVVKGQASDNANSRVARFKSIQSRIGAESLKQLSN